MSTPGGSSAGCDPYRDVMLLHIKGTVSIERNIVVPSIHWRNKRKFLIWRTILRFKKHQDIRKICPWNELCSRSMSTTQIASLHVCGFCFMLRPSSLPDAFGRIFVQVHQQRWRLPSHNIEPGLRLGRWLLQCHRKKQRWIYRVPTRTGKPGKMGRHFPVREKSGNFEQTGKVRENHTKYWKTEINWDKYYLIFLVIFKWTVHFLVKWIKFSVKKTKH